LIINADDGAAQSRLIARGVKIAKEIESLAPDRIRAMLMTLIKNARDFMGNPTRSNDQ
jgi:hypothetical protein